VVLSNKTITENKTIQMNKTLKLHLGCGHVHLPGFLNIDINPKLHIDLCADISNLPFDSSSVDLIYASSVLEHFGRHTWLVVLSHWSSLLKPGGIMRLSVPDFLQATLRYQSNKDLSELIGLVMGGQNDKNDHHGMIFDFQTLEKGLNTVGISNVERYKWQESDVGILDIDDFSQAYLPHMDKDNGRLMVLNVEGIKI